MFHIIYISLYLYIFVVRAFNLAPVNSEYIMYIIYFICEKYIYKQLPTSIPATVFVFVLILCGNLIKITKCILSTNKTQTNKYETIMKIKIKKSTRNFKCVICHTALTMFTLFFYSLVWLLCVVDIYLYHFQLQSTMHLYSLSLHYKV